MNFDLNFTHAYGSPNFSADFRSVNEDFIVEENLGFELEEEGEHLYVLIRKNGENTGWIAEALARHFNLRTSDVGYAGMKDRNAVTSQWFSLYLPKEKKDPEWQSFLDNTDSNIEVLDFNWHKKKLRRGDHQSNFFSICLRNSTGIDESIDRIEKINQVGVPNYFGEQRFGRDANNLVLAQKWFVEGDPIRKQKLRGIVISAARSYLFNQVLSNRVKEDSWKVLLDGDLPGSFPTGPLWGRGKTKVETETRDFEEGILQEFNSWLDGLEHCGLSQERRDLVLIPKNLAYTVEDNNLTISFSLAPGQFATSVLREISQLCNTN